MDFGFLATVVSGLLAGMLVVIKLASLIIDYLYNTLQLNNSRNT